MITIKNKTLINTDYIIEPINPLPGYIEPVKPLPGYMEPIIPIEPIL